MKPGFFDLDDPAAPAVGDHIKAWGVSFEVLVSEDLGEGFIRVTASHPKKGEVRVTYNPKGEITLPK